MRCIYKYKLPHGFEREVLMPRGARIVSAAMQGDQPTIWAEVDTEAKKLLRVFEVYPTGAEIEPDRIYVGTVFDGPYVWHIYEKAEEERCHSKSSA